jgi:hypothetical protein
MVLSTARKPEGGFKFISVVQLAMMWWAYRDRRIRLQDVRVWFAAQELLARRCQLKRGQIGNYTCEELYRLVGRRGDIPASLQRLQAGGLLTWEPGVIGFAEQPPLGHEQAGLETMLAKIRNHHRLVPVPRRLIRFIAGGCRRVVLATILGHLLRCLYYRSSQCKADGFCKASWIAEVFGVHVRNVKAARRYLEDIGLLQRTEVPQWVRNRYGQKMTINLQWVPPAAQTSAESAAGELPPPRAFSTLQLPPPDSHTELPTENTHQEPAVGRPSGFLSTLFQQAQEAIRTGAAPLTEPEPIVRCRVATPLHQEHPIAAKKESAPLPPPTLRHILFQDLKDTERLLALHTRAIQAELIGSSEAEQLAFFGLAQHVLAYRPENAGGLFRQLLARRCFHFITQEEEEAAQQRLKQHLYAVRGSPIWQTQDPSKWSRIQRVAA